VRPVMYGYARITDGTTQNDSIARIRHELTTYADQEGFALGEVQYSPKPQQVQIRPSPAWSTL